MKLSKAQRDVLMKLDAGALAFQDRRTWYLEGPRLRCVRAHASTVYSLRDAGLIGPHKRKFPRPFDFRVNWHTITDAGREALKNKEQKG